jgi:hypothetical protein
LISFGKAWQRKQNRKAANSTKKQICSCVERVARTEGGGRGGGAENLHSAFCLVECLLIAESKWRQKP